MAVIEAILSRICCTLVTCGNLVDLQQTLMDVNLHSSFFLSVKPPVKLTPTCLNHAFNI